MKLWHLLLINAVVSMIVGPLTIIAIHFLHRWWVQ